MQGTHEPRHQPRPPQDPFDYWLHLLVAVVIEPILELLRIAWRMIRGDWARPPSDHRGGSEARRDLRQRRP
jgi:hypothetical protein